MGQPQEGRPVRRSGHGHPAVAPAASSSAGSRLYPGCVAGRNEGARTHEPLGAGSASGSCEGARRH
eukprot:10702864-Alexandrium_andersonii.AAC.1